MRRPAGCLVDQVTWAALSTRFCTCLYSRFFNQVPARQGLLSFDEPFQRLLTQGHGAAITYKNRRTGKIVAAGRMWAIRPDPRDPINGERLDPPAREEWSKSRSPTRRSSRGDRPLRRLTRPDVHPRFKAPPEKDLEGMTPMWKAVPLPAATVAAGGNC